MTIHRGPLLTAMGHLRSTFPGIEHRLAATRAAGEQEISYQVPDARLGSVRLNGLYAQTKGSNRLAVILHGLGGHAGKAYCHRAALAARAAGFSSLRLSVRGADLSGEDVFHPALTGDLAMVLSAPALRTYCHVTLFGFSLGGTYALRAAANRVDSRIRAVVAVSPPLDIEAAVRAIDARARFIYRRYLMTRNKRIYAAVLRRGRGLLPMSAIRRVRTVRRLDELTLVERFGFNSVEELYSEVDVRRRIELVQVPALVLAGNHDPVVPVADTREALRAARTNVLVRWIDGGGHMHLPSTANLTVGGDPRGGWESQAFHWAETQCA